jgi:50S ribosomal subunit-associated GTPase HflX
MNATTVTVLGVVKPDGSLELEGKVPLPAGKVQVTVQPMPELPKDDPFWQMMQEIWAGQQARGHVPRGTEEVEAERRQLRQEWEDRMQEIERIQAESRRLRERAE